MSCVKYTQLISGLQNQNSSVSIDPMLLEIIDFAYTIKYEFSENIVKFLTFFSP